MDSLSQLKNVLIVVVISAAMAIVTSVIAYLFDTLPVHTAIAKSNYSGLLFGILSIRMRIG